ncbi:uncharacterized protein LOC126716087 isoform X2 [Quercus robur]|uniref:uncharacterized protein LOC126716087 isoform X2 n=1 Tax=Quercus robur TaxID=38942 RepID=UPI0021629BC7|nr:uncharacterized protein LOC126716087 isoform X2 [Quercus robur]
MTFNFLRRSLAFSSVVNSNFPLRVCRFCSTTILDKETDITTPSVPSSSYSSSLHLSPLFTDDDKAHSGSYDIELVDHDTWKVSSGLAQAWREVDGGSSVGANSLMVDEQVDSCFEVVECDQDFDDIDNMRIRGNLFYKLDRDSKEFEEYNLDFHRRKSSNRENGPKECKKAEKKEIPSGNMAPRVEKLPKAVSNKFVKSPLDEMDNACVGNKKLRTPTYNQLTGPYHEPFCLDIYISKASVRSCVIHRVTSKVVAVAHSISKDMKFDLASTRNVTACGAVGAVLAQRALADDIHDVVYTPRKGDRLEGKLQIVLQSIIDNGINVKVKLKQKRPIRGENFSEGPLKKTRTYNYNNTIPTPKVVRF